MKRIKRLLHLIQLLHQDQPISLETLRQELGVSRRTVFRDLTVLELAGVPCRFERQQRGYALDRAYFLPPVALTLEEALALMLLTRRALHRQLVPQHRSVASAALKVEACLPPSVRQHCGDVLAGVDFRYWPMSDAESITDLVAQLRQALAEHHKVALRYDSYSEGREIETVLHPYRLTFIRRGWYAIGMSECHGQVRTFKIERMTAARVLDEEFVPDEGFDLDEHFGNAWQMIRGDQRYHVVIRFSQQVAGNVEEVLWHKTQQTRRAADGSLVFEADVDGLGEIVWWVLGYGREAVVAEPPELRDLAAQHARAMVDHYASEPRSPTTESH